MSTQVDDLQIKLAAEASKAEKALDSLIAKIGTLEQKISSFGKVGKIDIGISKNADNAIKGTANQIKKEMESAGESVRKQSEKMSESVGAHIAKLRQNFGYLGKDFEKMGGFANLKTSEQMEKAIDNYRVKIAKAYESASKSGYGTKGFDSSIKSVIEYTNTLDALQKRLDLFNQSASQTITPQINIRGLNADAQTIEKTIQEVLVALNELYNSGKLDSPMLLRTAARDFEWFKKEISENANAYRTALGDDPALLNAIDGAIEHINTQLALMAERSQQSNAAMAGIEAEAASANQECATLGTTFDTITRKASSLPGILERVKLVKPTEEFATLQKEIDDTEKRLNKLKAQLERGLASDSDFAKTTTFQKLTYDIKEAEQELAHLRSEMEAMGNETHTLNFATIGEQAKASFETVFNTIKNITSAVTSLVRSIDKKVATSFITLAKNLNKTDDIAKRLVKSFTRVGNMLRLMITRMALRALISETRTSFGELLQFSEKTAESFNKIRNAIKYIADTFVTLAAPIMNASSTFAGLGNIIDMVSDKIVDLINKFNQLLSALLGHSTWIKATKQTKDYTKEVDKAGKAAKKALQPFDELNNITTNDSSSKNDDGTGGAQFSELPIDKKWKDIAKWLKEMWKKGDFTELGALLGEKLRDALNSIPWGKIQNTARKLASSLATLLNGFFKTEGLAKSIGNTIAQAINTGLIFAEEFIKKFDFAAFGKFIGDAIVTAIKNIHWKRFIDACKNLGIGLATAINSLINTGVIGDIGKAIGNIILGAVNFAFNFLTNIDFEALGSEILRGINNFLDVMGEVDKETQMTGWEKLGKAISTKIVGILKMLNTVLGDSETREKVGKAITDFLNQIDFAKIIGESVKLIANIALGLGNAIVSAFKSPGFRNTVLLAIPLLFNAFMAVFSIRIAGLIARGFLFQIGKMIAANIGPILVSELSAAIPAVGGAISSFFASISGALSTAAAAIGTSVAAMLGAIGLVIAAVVVWVHNWDQIKEAAGLFAERTKEHWEDLKAWFTTNMPYFSTLIGGIRDLLKNAFSGFVSDWSKDFEVFKKDFADVKERFGKGIGEIKTWLSGLKDWFVNIGNAIKIVFSAIFESIKNDIISKITNVKNSIQSGITLIKNLVEGVSEIIVGLVNGNLIEIYQGFRNTFESIKNYIMGFVNNAKAWGSQFVNNFKSAFANFGILSFGGVGSTIKNLLHLNESGGIYVNHQWKPIQGYAGGGMPKSAEMFLAREDGAPELVGKMGGHTAVANNDQIVASVSDGVYRAVRAAMSGQQGNTNVSVELVGDAAGLFKMVRKEGNNYQRRTGNPVFA